MSEVPVGLASELRALLGLSRACETGTFQGEGAEALARVFPSVVTVELSEKLHARAKARLRTRSNISFVLGDAREVLPRLVDPSVPTFWFLDGHWCDGPTAGGAAQCPVMTEVAALAAGHPDDCIVIDDARLFLAAPPPPYDPRHWPTIVEVIDGLRTARPGHHVTVLNDQVIAVPERARPAVDRHGQAWARWSPARRMVRRVLGPPLAPWSTSRRVLRTARRRVLARDGLRPDRRVRPAGHPAPGEPSSPGSSRRSTTRPSSDRGSRPRARGR